MGTQFKPTRRAKITALIKLGATKVQAVAQTIAYKLRGRPTQ